MFALLAPVPRPHLSDAVGICASAGNVAFGSGWISEASSGAWSFDFFSQEVLEKEVGHLPVFIYASHEPTSAGPRRAEYRGIYNGFMAALSNGKHQLPAERPKSALDGDTSGGLFWRVKSLEQLPQTPQSLLKNFRTMRAGKPHLPVTHIPRRPELVLAPDS
jgi:hypothetical protein